MFHLFKHREQEVWNEFGLTNGMHVFRRITLFPCWAGKNPKVLKLKSVIILGKIYYKVLSVFFQSSVPFQTFWLLIDSSFFKIHVLCNITIVVLYQSKFQFWPRYALWFHLCFVCNSIGYLPISSNLIFKTVCGYLFPIEFTGPPWFFQLTSINWVNQNTPKWRRYITAYGTTCKRYCLAKHCEPSLILRQQLLFPKSTYFTSHCAIK